MSIESSRTKEGRVEDVQSVGGGQDNDVGSASVETIHLDQELKRNKNRVEIVKKAKKSNNNVKNLYRFWEAKY